jgi:thioredoxin 1
MRILSKQTGVTFLMTFAFLLISCNQNPKSTSGKETTKQEETNYKVTFIELGSVRCIPCQQMQLVMKSIKEKYSGQVNVVFHDVWTEAGAPFAKQYGIEAIPTQVFLDKEGKEYFRHVGFFPEEELVKVLNQKGVK